MPPLRRRPIVALALVLLAVGLSGVPATVAQAQGGGATTTTPGPQGRSAPPELSPTPEDGTATTQEDTATTPGRLVDGAGADDVPHRAAGHRPGPAAPRPGRGGARRARPAAADAP